MTERMSRQQTQPTKDTTTHSTLRLHNNIPQTQPQPTHTALQQSQRMTEMTMTVGRRRHGIIVAAPGCQGLPLTLPCCRHRCPTGGSGPRSEGGSTADRRRGDRGIAAVATAALVQWARIPTRGACGSGTCRVGPGGRASTLHASP